MIKFHAYPLLAGILAVSVAGCGGDKSDTAGSGTTGAGTTTGTTGTTDTAEPEPVLTHESGFGLVGEVLTPYAFVESTAEWYLTATEDGVSGLVAYSESGDAGECTATLSFVDREVSFDEAADTNGNGVLDPDEVESPRETAADTELCDGCDWERTFATTRSVSSGACLYPDAETSLDHAASFSAATTAATIGAIDDGLMVSVASAEGGVSFRPGGSYTAATGALEATTTASATVPLHWRDCPGLPAPGTPGELTPGDLAVSSGFTCQDSSGSPAFEQVELWTRDLAFGQELTAGIRSTDSRLQLLLITPDGCLAYEAPSAGPCATDPATSCTSLVHTVTQGGPHTLAVLTESCGESFNYLFDARVGDAG